MKVVKSISFNDNNEKEAQMLRIFKRRSFSKYVKQLIIADMKKQSRKESEKESQKEVENQPEPKPSIYEVAAKKAIKQPKQNRTQTPQQSRPLVNTTKFKSQNGAITFDFTKGGM